MRCSTRWLAIASPESGELAALALPALEYRYRVEPYAGMTIPIGLQ